MRYFCFLLITALTLHAQDAVRLELQPLDFQSAADGDFHLTGISQIESEGNRIYLRSSREPEIIVISPEGRLIQKIGGKGDHPAEFGHTGVLAMAVKDSLLWGIDIGRGHVRRFENGKYQESFRLASYKYSYAAVSSNLFAFSGDQIVIPNHPFTKGLATVYNAKGEIIREVGEPLPFFEELEQRIPGINDTLWDFDGKHWYSIHQFAPVVTVYTKDFQLKHQHQIESPVLTEAFVGMQEFHATENYNRPSPIINDAKMHNDKMYLMSQGCLHQIDPETGRVERLITFYGSGKDFAETTGSNVTLFFFAFLDNGRIVLGHPAMLWNHDLWLADLSIS
jgi:hypothetical protein